MITHAHSDHARRGSETYWCTTSGVGLLRHRLGQKIEVHGVPFREAFQLNGVEVSFHPAGHVLGSSQVRVSYQGEVWVASGDYKRGPDPSCEPFESVPCDVFVTEATFGTPSYQWPKSQCFGEEISNWWRGNRDQGFNSLLYGYSLGKAQRILAELKSFAIEPIWVHPAIAAVNACYEDEGIPLAPYRSLEDCDPEKDRLKGALILAPPAIRQSPWATSLGEFQSAFASGWMQRQSPHRGNVDKGFVMSDHADWTELNLTIQETGASRIYVMHRGSGALVRHLRSQGLEAYPIEALAEPHHRPQSSMQLRLW